MLDQTFSAENLRAISEYEKRRGRVLDLTFFPEVKLKTDALKEKIRATKSFRKSHSKPYSLADQAAFDNLQNEREIARSERDEVLLNCLRNVSDIISKKNYSINFTKSVGPKGKYVFKTDPRSADQYYAIKQLSKNFNRLYKVKQSSRNDIIVQLSDYMSDKFPYHIIKVDITEFFESIRHDLLIEKIKKDQLLSHASTRLIQNILYRYSLLSGVAGKGVPRGLGISSYLSELYMREFDEEMRGTSDVVFYARYVDDIIVLFAPKPTSLPKDYLGAVQRALARKELQVNDAKTNQSPLSGDGKPMERNGWKFEYLGYEFAFDPKLKIRLSQTKYDKYLQRLTASFHRYKAQRARDAKGAYRLLVKRIRFLTGNTQLTHNKENAYVGIFFSNPHLTDLAQLKSLDGKLKGLCAALPSASLKTELDKYSFYGGYIEKVFRRFHRKDEFGEIIKAWKYGR
ncbi:antiviral reverse transcriptase Drt3a [Shinella sp.]|uniref:antiviral reverse transcriptase Drt3a n=1 Tax=Shinella sp. TaxID=1870904 RepID=UPI003F6ECA18